MAMADIRASPTAVVVGSCIAQLIDNITYTISFACLPHLFEDMKLASESQIGLVAAMFGIGGFLTSSLSGFVSDRLQSRKLPLVVGSIGYAICGCVLFFSHKLWHLLLYRLLNGMASGLVYPISTAAVGDVYPHKLLGLQMALLNVFNNAGYMIGPILGGAIYDHAGVRGVSTVVTPALVVIGLGLLKLAVFAIMAVDSLVIRDMIQIDEEPATKEPRITSISVQPKSMSILHLLLRPPVVIATILIVASLGIQGMLEGLVPLHLVDTLKRPNVNGITFVILGLVFTVLVPIVGKVNDMLIDRHGERMRYYMMLIGSLIMILAMVLMSLANSYGVLMVGYSFFALANLCMCIPAQSAYGDFINGSGTDSMARGYSIGVCAWAAGGIILPPSTIWITSSTTALVNRLIYTLTVASIPDLLQKTMGVSRASNGIVTAAFGIGGLVAGSLIGYVSDRTQNRIGPQLCASVLYVASGLVLYFAKHFYQIVIFRLILGIASSIADTMLFTTVADVYPANLLGFKTAVIFVFDNVGNMLGPLLGGKAYEHMGVGGIAIIAIALGLFELCMILIFSHAMAQCYSLAWIAEGLANIILPPIASAQYYVPHFKAVLFKITRKHVE
ncbi:hypothetical protein GGF49_000465 [Coemansia sp. RSA 1853]|nr:hypothetical protein GGF49_000465 [Coemansia sp. RSA 1853]